ncbi:MAG: hypothetical protein ABI147_02225 [Acidobacteriaceae bacterium]
MATLPKTDLTARYLTAEELLAVRGTPEFEIEYRRQRTIIAEHMRKIGRNEAAEFFDWNVPGWTYDAEL